MYLELVYERTGERFGREGKAATLRRHKTLILVDDRWDICRDCNHFGILAYQVAVLDHSTGRPIYPLWGGLRGADVPQFQQRFEYVGTKTSYGTDQTRWTEDPPPNLQLGACSNLGVLGEYIEYELETGCLAFRLQAISEHRLEGGNQRTGYFFS